jgi:hypothetical protein
MAPTSVEEKICIVGSPSSGKSIALNCLQSALSDQFHGYGKHRHLKLRTMSSEAAQRVAQMHTEKPKSTAQASELHYDIEIREPDGTPKLYQVQALDVRGEVFLDPPTKGALLKEYEEQRKKYEDWRADSVGAVVMYSAPHLFVQNQKTPVLAEVQKFANDPTIKLKRVVIALTMFELLMIPFGRYALDFASQPKQMRKWLKAVLERHERDFLNTLVMADNLDIRFIAVSSFGFVRGVGSPNISSDDSVLMAENRPICDPFEPNVYYPFLVADPFVFAATGEENDFLVPIAEVV